jgi:hypothetical protein
LIVLPAPEQAALARPDSERFGAVVPQLEIPLATMAGLEDQPVGGDPTTAADIYSGIASKIVSSGGMTAQDGRLRAKIAIFGWKEDGSSRVPA